MTHVSGSGREYRPGPLLVNALPLAGGSAIMAAMCELFAMSSRLATSVTISLEELARRGGETGPHDDEDWMPLAEGDLVVLKDGAIVGHVAP